MGLFDNFLKQIDDGLKAVENGALEDRLNKVADKLDKVTEKAEKTLGNAAEKPSQTLKTVETKAKHIKAQAGKSMDILHKKD